jgi:hypothetical protein
MPWIPSMMRKAFAGGLTVSRWEVKPPSGHFFSGQSPFDPIAQLLCVHCGYVFEVL